MAYLISPTDEVVVWRDLLGVSLTMECEHISSVYSKECIGSGGLCLKRKGEYLYTVPPPDWIVKKVVLPFFPPSCLSWYILHSCLSQKWSIYRATMLCLWMLNVQCKDLYFFFLFGSICRKSVIASPVLHSAKMKKKTTHKAVPHLRIVLYFSRQIKIFNKLCTF